MKRGAGRAAGQWANLFPPSVFFLACFFAVLFWYLLQWPVEAFDTDLWYHLSAGRYLFAHGHIPHDSFFSFLEPPRLATDYYWLFQALAYRLYRWRGYAGLIALRSALGAALAAVVAAISFGKSGQKAPKLWRVVLVTLGLLVLLSRLLVIRPHLFTYFFIGLFIWVLDQRPKLAWLLPAVAVAWFDIHGVTYPIAWLIAGAYAVEYALAKPSKDGKSRWGLLASLAAVFAATLLTPHGAALLRVPFISTARASLYINELYPLTFESLTSIHIVQLAPTEETIFLVSLALALLCLIGACIHRPKLSQLILFAAGLVLLTRGSRFECEFVLLALPLMRDHPLLPQGFMVRVPRLVYGACMLLGMVLPLAALASLFLSKPAYPVSFKKLPVGVCAFLKQAHAGGRLLNYPNDGGYLQWMLYPEYKIYSDMQVPFLFKDQDMQFIRDVYSGQQPQALARCLATYQPDFIIVETALDRFAAAMKRQPRFVPVFFDDAEALYVDKERHPDLAARYALIVFDPFVINDQTPEEAIKGNGRDIPPKDPQAASQELDRLLAVYPESGIANVLAAYLDLNAGRYAQALEHARRIMKSFPNTSAGFSAAGDAFKGLGRYVEALRAYQQAADNAKPSSKAQHYRKMGQVYLAQGQAQKAYRLLKANTDIYEPRTRSEDIFYLGHAALLSGKPAEARQMLEYLAAFRLEAGQKTTWAAPLKKDLEKLRADGDAR